MRRYVVLGAGAVGASIGARLHETGARVALVARGAHLDAIRRDGLILATPSRTRTLRIEAVARVGELRVATDDVVLLCTKSQDTAAALEELAREAPRSTSIVCAQNGVSNERLAAARFDRVYGAVVFAPASFVVPGRVTLHAEPCFGALDVGAHTAAVDDLVHAVVRDLSTAGFAASAEPHVMRLKYGKLLTNLGNAVQALAGAEGLASPILARLEDEAVACLGAATIDFATKEEIVRRYSAIRDRPVEGVARGGGSTWQSLARGVRSIETDSINGEIVRLGERHGVATPCNAAITRLAVRAARDGWPPEAMTVAELEAALA